MMMQGLRKAGQTWLGKVLVALLFGFLIFSFAIWGIGDIFRGGGRADQVVNVGKTSVTTDELRSSFQQELQRLSRQVRKNVTPEQARAFGVDQQVLARLTSEATLDEATRLFNINIPDSLVAESILSAPEFQNTAGVFSRNIFDEILRNNGLNEAGFFTEQKRSLARVFLGDALTAYTPISITSLEAMHRYGAERRSIDYVVLNASHVGKVVEPSVEQLKAFFSQNIIRFKAPEYRAANALVLSPSRMQAQIEISDADLNTFYNAIKTERFGTPERRVIDQITFANVGEAQAAVEKIKAGMTFDQLAKERSLSPETLRLGTFSKAEMFDKVVADAAFLLPNNVVSSAIEGRFGVAIIRIFEIIPEKIQPLKDVKDTLIQEMRLTRAREKVTELHDKIEDQRAAAKPLTEIVKSFDLKLTVLPAVSRTGQDKDQKSVEANGENTIADLEMLIPAIYRSDIGIDNEALATKDRGYIWYDVTGIEKARERNFEEVQTQLTAQWREEDTAKRLKEIADKIVERLNADEQLASIAKEFKLEVKSATDLARGVDQSGLSRAVVTRAFTTQVKQAATVEDEGINKTLQRVVFKVKESTTAPFIRSTKEAGELEERLKSAISEDLLAQYIQDRQKDFGVNVNQKALRNAIGVSGGE